MVLSLLIISCNRQSVIICSPDESQCITVITRAFSDTRYVINGSHSTIPDSAFVKVRLSNHYRPGDTINICWKNDEYEWEAIINRSTIIENKLDSEKHLFSNKLDLNDIGVPTEKRFREPNCVSVSLYNDAEVYPKGHAILIEH